jgi:hypothetical protein
MNIHGDVVTDEISAAGLRLCPVKIPSGHSEDWSLDEGGFLSDLLPLGELFNDRENP